MGFHASYASRLCWQDIGVNDAGRDTLLKAGFASGQCLQPAKGGVLV